MENGKVNSAVPIAPSQVTTALIGDNSPSLAEVVANVMERRWLVLASVVFGLIMGVGWIFFSKPIYRADSLVQVEEQSGAAAPSALRELAPLLGDNTTVAAELEILTSRMVLGRVVEKLQLNIEANPKYFPLLGSTIARKYDGVEVNDPLFSLQSFGWGGESIKVDSLEVSLDLQDVPLILTVENNENFVLKTESGSLELAGSVGRRVDNKYVSIFVSSLKARPGTKFVLIKNSVENAITALRNSIVVKERGKKSGILEVSLQGPDRHRSVFILDEILKTYVRQNVERRSAEAENTLKFLETQLPRVKRELDVAEAAYNAYRQSRGSLDLSIETQSVLQSIVEIDNQIVALKQERDELRQSFTSQHPRVQAVDQRLDRLRERRQKFDGDVAGLPDTQQRVLQLARDVEVSTTLYTNLLNTAQQLRVSKAGTVGDVRIIDTASSAKEPVGVKPSIIIFIAASLGLAVALVLIYVNKAFRTVVEDPDLIEEKIGLPVYATVPHSQDETVVAKQRGQSQVLAVVCPEDDAIESLRGLRTTIHFALMDASHNSILITGPSPGLGKSFISKNLGAVLAQAGQRVVIVDADLRKGHINKEFGVKREIGVSEYVIGTADIDEIIKPTSVPNLWLVSTGEIPPNPSELLMHLRFEQMLEQLEGRFDALIVDAPPILAVSDAAIIGRHVGATLMVARAGYHPIQELEQAVKRMNQGGVEVKGFVFNDYDVNRQRYRYGYKGYVYRYSYKDKN